MTLCIKWPGTWTFYCVYYLISYIYIKNCGYVCVYVWVYVTFFRDPSEVRWMLIEKVMMCVIWLSGGLGICWGWGWILVVGSGWSEWEFQTMWNVVQDECYRASGPQRVYIIEYPKHEITKVHKLSIVFTTWIYIIESIMHKNTKKILLYLLFEFVSDEMNWNDQHLTFYCIYYFQYFNIYHRWC